jgi:hypothetical protein
MVPPEQHAPDRLQGWGRLPSDRSNSRRGGFLYAAFAKTFRAFRGINFATRLRWLFDLLKPRAIAGGANNLSQHVMRSFHHDQSLKTKQKIESCEDSGVSQLRNVTRLST